MCMKGMAKAMASPWIGMNMHIVEQDIHSNLRTFMVLIMTKSEKLA